MECLLEEAELDELSEDAVEAILVNDETKLFCNMPKQARLGMMRG